MSTKNKKNKKQSNEISKLSSNISKENIITDEPKQNENIFNDETLNNNKTNETEPKNKGNKSKKKGKKPKKNTDSNKDKNNVGNNNDNKDQIKPEPKVEVIETKVVNELPKNDVLENKIVNVIYKIVYVYNNQDNYMKVKPELKIINIINRISKKLNVSQDQLILSYRDQDINGKYYDMTVKEFFNFPKNKSRPILYVRIKQNKDSNNIKVSSSAEFEKYIFCKKNYDNKIKIMNYPSLTDLNVGINDDIYSIVNEFLKEVNVTSDFTCERKEENNKNDINADSKSNNNDEQNSNLNNENNMLEENKSDINLNNNNDGNKNTVIYIIGFPSPDLAFDFNRYMNSLRLMNPTFKNIKIQVLLSRKKSKKNRTINDETSSKKNNHNYRYGASLNLEEQDLEKRNIEILNIVRNNFLNNRMNEIMKGNNNSNYLNISTPYTTPYDERIKEIHENKKKWLSPKGFISSVNKYSGIHI
jgi:hypothetical protein